MLNKENECVRLPGVVGAPPWLTRVGPRRLTGGLWAAEGSPPAPAPALTGPGADPGPPPPPRPLPACRPALAPCSSPPPSCAAGTPPRAERSAQTPGSEHYKRKITLDSATPSASPWKLTTENGFKHKSFLGMCVSPPPFIFFFFFFFLLPSLFFIPFNYNRFLFWGHFVLYNKCPWKASNSTTCCEEHWPGSLRLPRHLYSISTHVTRRAPCCKNITLNIDSRVPQNLKLGILSTKIENTVVRSILQRANRLKTGYSCTANPALRGHIVQYWP